MAFALFQYAHFISCIHTKIKIVEAGSIRSLMSPDLWQCALTVNYIGFDLRHDYVESSVLLATRWPWVSPYSS